MKTKRTLPTTLVLLAAVCAPELAAQEPRTEPGLGTRTTAVDDTMKEMERIHQRGIRDSVTRLESQIADLQDLRRRLTMEIAERQIRLLRLRRTLADATPRIDPGNISSRLDEMNDTLTRLNTLMTLLAEQHRSNDETNEPSSDNPVDR